MVTSILGVVAMLIMCMLQRNWVVRSSSQPGGFPGHHVLAIRRLDRVARQGRQPRQRRGRRAAESLDEDESSQRIRGVMARFAASGGGAPDSPPVHRALPLAAPAPP